jgi:hypothetical protein
VRLHGAWLMTLLIATVYTLGCGNYRSHSSMTMTGTTPMITQLMPNRAISGGSAFTLMVIGNGFGTDATLYWNFSARQTSYASGSHLSAVIMATDIATPGVVPVYVRSDGQNSNTVNFTVN